MGPPTPSAQIQTGEHAWAKQSTEHAGRLAGRAHALDFARRGRRDAQHGQLLPHHNGAAQLPQLHHPSLQDAKQKEDAGV